jgi:hypothetical protein
LDREAYLVTLQAARQVGVYSLGHIPEDPEVVHAKEALGAGLNEIAHLDQLTHEFLVDYDPGVRGWVEWELDTERIYEVVQGIVPGFSEQRELELLIEAGFTPFEAPAAGTEDTARITERMKADSNWGTIEVGNRADLILLSKNPLTDIRNSSSIHGVVVRGQRPFWL